MSGFLRLFHALTNGVSPSLFRESTSALRSSSIRQTSRCPWRPQNVVECFRWCRVHEHPHGGLAITAQRHGVHTPLHREMGSSHYYSGSRPPHCAQVESEQPRGDHFVLRNAVECFLCCLARVHPHYGLGITVQCQGVHTAMRGEMGSIHHYSGGRPPHDAQAVSDKPRGIRWRLQDVVESGRASPGSSRLHCGSAATSRSSHVPVKRLMKWSPIVCTTRIYVGAVREQQLRNLDVSPNH
jgi:hypothetical protein